MAVSVERDVDRAVSELGLEELRVRASRHHECRVGVPKVVEAQRCEVGTANGGPEHPGHEVVLTPDASVWSGEDELELVRRAGDELLAEDAERLPRKANLPASGTRLRRR